MTTESAAEEHKPEELASPTSEAAEHDAKVAEVRGSIEGLLTTDYLRHWCNDIQLRRFLKAERWDVRRGTERLKSTLQWRAKEVPEAKVCSYCARNAKAHHMFQCGADKAGRPIIYSCFGMACERTDGKGNVEHMCGVLDRCLETMPKGVDSYVWICDFHGFGFQDCNIATAMGGITVFALHYPETLAGLYIVGAPRIFDWFWPSLLAAIRLANATLTKIHFLQAPDGGGAGEPLRPALAELCSEELALWLAEEMEENRNWDVTKDKVGWLDAVKKQNGVTRPDGKHDLRGPKSFRESPAAQIAWGTPAA